MITTAQLVTHIETARSKLNIALMEDNMDQMLRIQFAMNNLYDSLLTNVKGDNNMKDIKMKLVVFGDDSQSKLMTYGQYTEFLRSVSQLEFDTHLAIDIDLNPETIKALQSVVRDCNELSVKADLKLIQGEK